MSSGNHFRSWHRSDRGIEDWWEEHFGEIPSLPDDLAHWRFTPEVVESDTPPTERKRMFADRLWFGVLLSAIAFLITVAAGGVTIN